MRVAAVGRVAGPSAGALVDGIGRRLRYLRLSVTEACNFRCAYCLPDGRPPGPMPSPLSVVEIRRLVTAFAALGVEKVRLTGGEPTLREDVGEIVRAVAEIPGLRVALTTNGYRLARVAGELREAGLAAVNVSVDSLAPARFEAITGRPLLSSVVAGVEAALAAGIPSVKVNAVLLRGFDDVELERFLAWTRRAPLTVRFIELMRTAGNGAFFRARHLDAAWIARALEARGWEALPDGVADGPAVTWGHSDHAGRVGIIAPYAEGFCDTCNRVRVSAAGNLRLCLFGDAEIPLRRHLHSDLAREALTRAISGAVVAKPPSHRLRDGDPGATASFAMIGG
ncbi:MAG: GTP 3',8-cyclase MoaA [Anaeromyxobacteraceae bacterium]